MIDIDVFNRARQWWRDWKMGKRWCFDCERTVDEDSGTRLVPGMSVAVCGECFKVTDAKERLG